MTKDEASILVEESNEQYKERWERERFNAYITALSAGAEITSPVDLICFSWEEKQEKKKPSKEEIEHKRKQMLEAYEKYKSGNVKSLSNLPHGKI